MTNVMICGILGRMGRQLVECASGSDTQIVCGFDVRECELDGIPVYSSFEGIKESRTA